MKNAYATYKSANVDTADQGKLIIIAYDVAIKHCRLALEIFQDQKQIEERTRHLFKVQDALTELMSSLRLDVGEIAQNLYKLYDYMVRQLVHANARHKAECVNEVLGYLVELRSAWQEAIQVVKSEQSANISTNPSKNVKVTG